MFAVTCHLAQVGVGHAGGISALNTAAELTMIRLSSLPKQGPHWGCRGMRDEVESTESDPPSLPPSTLKQSLPLTPYADSVPQSNLTP